MKKPISFFTLCIFLLLISCVNPQKIDNKIEVFDYSLHDADTQLNNMSRFFKSHISINFAHINIRIIKGELVISSLSTDLSEFYIYNCKTDSLIKSQIDYKKIPKTILSVYTHSLDSIFFLCLKRENKLNTKPLYILTNSKVEILKKYYLSELTNFFNDKKETLIENNISTYQNRIINNKLLHPMAIYLPKTEDLDYKNYMFKQLSFIDLETGNIELLDAKFPEKDVGKKYNDGVSTNRIHFYIINEDSIIYTFTHTPAIYLLKKKNDTYISSLINEFNEVYFQNLDSTVNNSNSFVYNFDFLEFSKSENMYFRKIEIRKYKDFEKSEVIQLFNNKLKHIGYLAASDTNYPFSCFGNEIHVFNKNTELFNSIKLKEKSTFNINEFENKYLKKKQSLIENNTTKSGKNFDITKIPINLRMAEYLKKMDTDYNKLIIFNVDMMCISCVSYLMTSLKNEKEYFESNKIGYIFIGRDIENAVNLLSKYDVDGGYKMDIVQEYYNYFEEKELSNYILIKLDSNNNSIVNLKEIEFEEFETETKDFLK